MKYRYFSSLFALLLLVSCEPEIELPDFQVSVPSDTFQAGEEIRFQIQGNADMIYFYSGEPTNDFAFRSGRVIEVADEGATLEFTSAVTGGTQEDQLSLLVSKDFDGNYSDLASIKSANWVDITDRFQWGSSATFLSSTTQDITDLVEPGQPVYFAFKYLTRPQETHGLARTWMIQNFQVNSKELFDGNPVTISDLVYSGFRIVDQEPENAPSRSSITTTRITILGNVYKDPNDPIYDPDNPIYDPENPIYDPESHLYEPDAELPTFVPYDPDSPYNDPQTETWAVSAPITIDQVDLGPDPSVPIKGIANSRLEEYRYTYTTPGTYKAHFVAKNATIEGSKEIVQALDITILP